MKLNVIREGIFSAVAFLIVILFPSIVLAGEIFGSVKAHNKLNRVEINCDAETYRGDIDQYGAYKVLASKTGKCKIRFQYGNNWTNSFTIRSYKKASRYDFKVDGDNNLRRE